MSNKKQDWELAILSLVQPYESVRLKCDDININFNTSVYNMKIVIAWYVDGVYKGVYSNLNSEIGKKFGQEIKTGYNRKMRELINVVQRTPSARKKAIEEHENKVLMYSNYWTCPKKLIKKLKVTCTKIELVKND